MDLFNPESGLVIWMLVVFLLLLFILGKFAYPYITKAIPNARTISTMP